MHVLETVVPGLVQRLATLSLEQRRRIIAIACDVASRGMPNLEPAVQRLLRLIKERHALSDSEVVEARMLGEAADERYFTLQEGDAERAVWLEWFYKARLLLGIAQGFGKNSWHDSGEAIYQFCNARPDPSDIVRCVESEIRALSESGG
jgi:hypothetical protein